MNSRHALLSRRAWLMRSTAFLALAGTAGSDARMASRSVQDNEQDEEILGQGAFRYRPQRSWGELDPQRHPVKDCHGIAEDRRGRIVMLTNDTHNNLIAYDKSGTFLAAWERRFPAAHGFEIADTRGQEHFWITDHDRQTIAMCTPEGREVRFTGPEAVAEKYPDLNTYHPTCTAVLPDGDFFVADGYGSSFVHHFDPNGRYISSFGGEGPGPEHLLEPHAVWLDTRSGQPLLLVCDRAHEMLKWFSLEGELLRVVPVPGARPSNVARFKGRLSEHLAIASLNGMILILDGADRIVSVIGGQAPTSVEGKLLALAANNRTFIHPHDVYVDSDNALYVVQWNSNQTYPIKLTLL